MAPFPAYIICTAPRSGSTLLCRLLQATGVAGAPGSLFHRPSLDDWRRAYDLPSSADLRQIVAAALATGRGGTDVFGLRLQRHSFAFFTQQLAVLHPDQPTDKDRITAAFGKTLFLFLSREDKLDQAISLVKAQQSGLWHRAPDGTEIERLSAPAEPVFDRAALEAKQAEFTRFDADWRAWFDAQGIAPLCLTYAGLAADPQGAVRRILTALGQDPSQADGIEPATDRLADATSAEWKARLLEPRAQG